MNNRSIRSLSRKLTVIENDLAGAEEILHSLKPKEIPVIGITGPPGAGKSSLLARLLHLLSLRELRVAVLSVDPSSTLHSGGALLGDRIRMQGLAGKTSIFIRSVASRGHLGGLSMKLNEMIDVLKADDFDLIFVETVGVGQSEIDIVSTADTTVLVLVPEAGDEIQCMKSGIMEIADVFVVNKSDREGSDLFTASLRNWKGGSIPVLQTSAKSGEGAPELLNHLLAVQPDGRSRSRIIANRAWNLIAELRMRDIDLEKLQGEINEAQKAGSFNLYDFATAKAKNS